MSMLRGLRLRSKEKSRTPESKLKGAKVDASDTKVSGRRVVERSETFTLKYDDPHLDKVKSNFDEQSNFNTYTRKKDRGNIKPRADVFDALYHPELANLKPRERKSTSFNDEIDFIPDTHFDGGTYRKPKNLSRTDTFTKKSPPRSYIFGEEQICREPSYESDESNDLHENHVKYSDDKVKDVMTWFVDVTPAVTHHKKTIPVERRGSQKSETLLEFPNTNYRISPPKPVPRTSLIKRNETFRINEPIQVEVERKSSNVSNRPIRIEIRNPPPLTEREYESSRPIGIATPYNAKTKLEAMKKRQSFSAKSSSSSPSHHDTSQRISPNRASQNDVTDSYNNSFSQSRFDSIRRKFSGQNDNKAKIATRNQVGVVNSSATLPPAKPSRAIHPTPTPDPKTKNSTKPKKLQQLWTTLNRKVHPKRNNNNDTQVPATRYSHTSQVIQQEEKNDKMKPQKEKLSSSADSRKGSSAASTFSWLMKVKSRK